MHKINPNNSISIFKFVFTTKDSYNKQKLKKNPTNAIMIHVVVNTEEQKSKINLSSCANELVIKCYSFIALTGSNS